MCMEDIRLARETGSYVRAVPLTVGVVTTILPASEDRVGFTVSVAGTGAVVISPEGLDPLTTDGVILIQTNLPAKFRIEDFGSVLRGVWRATVFTANSRITIFEQTLGKR